jgi:hypothetical protein
MQLSTKVLLVTVLPDLRGLNTLMHSLSRELREDMITVEEAAALAVIKDHIEGVIEEIEQWAEREGETQ